VRIMAEPTEEDKKLSREFVTAHRFAATRGDPVLEAAVETGAYMRAAGRDAERDRHREYLKKALRMAEGTRGTTMLRAFLEATLENLDKGDGHGTG
jgi:hypothetical protein